MKTRITTLFAALMLISIATFASDSTKPSEQLQKELWVADGYNMRVHVFNAQPPYQQLTTIPLQDMPGWILFSMDGKYAYPSSGEVVDSKTRKIITVLQDEFYNTTSS